MSESTTGAEEIKDYRKVSGVSSGAASCSLASGVSGQSKKNHLESSGSAFTNFFRSVWNKMSGSVSSSSDHEEYPEFIDRELSVLRAYRRHLGLATLSATKRRSSLSGY